MNRSLILLSVLSILLFSCNQDKTYIASEYDYALERALDRVGGKSNFRLPASDDFTNIPQDPYNQLSAVKVELGKLLFFETGLALSPRHEIGRGTYSCASCHIPSAGFRPGRPQGIADGGAGFGENGEGRFMGPVYAEDELDVQGIRPLSVLNVAYVTNTLWNGQFGSEGANVGTEALWSQDTVTEINHLGFAALESQNIEGLDLHRMVVNKEVTDTYGYTPYFDAAFGEYPEAERYTHRTASFAISAYLRTLLTNEAPFQKWLAGKKDALTDAEKRGAILFFDKANCGSCHRSPSLGAGSFYALGVNDLYQTGALNTDASDKKNLGRGSFTGEQEDMFKFKVPQLYNLADAPFYFHGGSQETLRDVIDYFNAAIPENANVPESQIAANFVPLYLSDEEIEDLEAFLSNALRDPNLDRYVPQQILSGNCFPNNDPFSRVDLGCD